MSLEIKPAAPLAAAARMVVDVRVCLSSFHKDVWEGFIFIALHAVSKALRYLMLLSFAHGVLSSQG